MPRKRKEEVPVEPGKGLNLDPELIKQLVPGTLDRASINEQFAALKKAIFERALGGELTHHLGYEKGEAKPAGRTNHRNGTSRKRIATDNDLLDVEIPRDREGTFDPVLIAKGERRFTGFDDKIIAMYARGMSVREIQGFLLEMYGIEVSPDFISTVTHALRHTFASHFMMNGGNILTLQRILGHQSLTMTMRYAHLAPEHLQEAKMLNPLRQFESTEVAHGAKVEVD